VKYKQLNSKNQQTNKQPLATRQMQLYSISRPVKYHWGLRQSRRNTAAQPSQGRWIRKASGWQKWIRTSPTASYGPHRDLDWNTNRDGERPSAALWYLEAGISVPAEHHISFGIVRVLFICGADCKGKTGLGSFAEVKTHKIQNTVALGGGV